MKAEKSFHPVLPNVILYDRMFRVKPYTKCIDCLTQDKLRCQNCMEAIIEDIAKNNNPKRLNEKKKSLPVSRSQHMFEGSEAKRIIKTSSSNQKLQTQSSDKWLHRSNKENREKIVITSKYNWWMNEKKRRNQESVELGTTLMKNWPRKTRAHDYNLQKLGAKQPRFQKWEKKLLDQLLSKTNRFA